MTMLYDDIISILFDYSCDNSSFLIYIKKNNFNIGNKNFVNCYQLSRDRELSLEFVDLFYNQIKWDVISRYTLLEESILYKYHYKLNWRYISLYQNLSLNFILFNYDWLYEKKLKHNKNFSKDFIQNIIYKQKGDKYMMKLVNSNKRYKKLRYLYC
jgi:hypothetical protein